MRTRTHRLALAGLLAGTLVLTACGSGDDPTVGSGTDSATTADRAQFNQTDVDFVSGMVPHHEQAVEMADIISDKEPSPQVAALAEQIKAAQQPEIEQLNTMLETFGEDAGSGGHGGSHGGGSDTPEHGGMMSEEDMQTFKDASGTEAERIFLESMIAHHKGAVEASETEIADGQHQPAIDLAKQIREDQLTEIAEMEQLLTQL
jgi:uncharacterized protein (DUF305 family)